MITVHGTEIDFDITAPQDLRRYHQAGKKMTQAAATLKKPADEDSGLEPYIAYMEAQCRLLTDFIDEAMGQGTCDKLLGPKTSLEKLLELSAEIGDAMAQQGKELGDKMQKYTPNRTARRSKK